MSAITELLQSLGLERYVDVFEQNEVDLETLRLLNEDDLRELGLPFGPRKKLLNAIVKPAEPAHASSPAESASERRQLTVLFCDMVGFTELATRTDPEILEKIIRAYEDQCAACISRYDGYVFQRLGDGIVAFFGFPLAHEGEAERAVRAGLEIIDAMTRLEVPEVGRLRVRIGVSTGIVVVSLSEKSAVGETMNLASRLQNIATPGSMVVSERVHRLAGGAFSWKDLGEFDLKGIERPTRAWAVLGAGSAESRFDAATASGLVPLVAREAELAALLGLWRVAKQRSGRVVLLSGEAGIGKSRLLNALRVQVQSEPVSLIRLQCSAFYLNSAYYPIRTAIERALAFDREEPASSRLDKIERFVADTCGLPVGDARFLATMLSVPFEARYGRLAISPQLMKSEISRVLVETISGMVRGQPGLMLVEDLHWADPTTLEVLGRVIERVEGLPLLLVGTYRPEFDSPWVENGCVSVLHLARFTPDQSRALIARVTAGKALPAEISRQIVARADGVPLFLEELTKAILSSGDLAEDGNRYVHRGPSTSVPIPETLRDSLAARLDRVPAAREVAQVGSVIGREFSYGLISALELMPEQALRQALSQLVESELVTHNGPIAAGSYAFRHALVQDAAYDSLLRSRRQVLHGRIAAAIQQDLPDVRDHEPELLAHHYTAANMAEQAIPCWQRAGEVAMKRFALAEAVTHLRKGMELTAALPASPVRDLMELGLRTILAPAVVAQRGWGNAEVSAILEPAWRLAGSLGQHAAYLPILSALWVHYMCIGQLAISLRWVEKLLDIGEELGDDNVQIVGYRAAAASYFWLGDFLAARDHGDFLRAMYHPERHWHIAQLTNFDPLTGEGVYRGQYLWMLGYPDQAVSATHEKDEHARHRNHPFDLAFALTLGAQVFDHLHEPDELLRAAQEAERVGREHGVALLWEVMAEISRGIALLRGGRPGESVDQLGRAIARLSATGHRIWIQYLTALRAEGLALTGDIAGAGVLIDECVLTISGGEERVHYAEILRLQGWIRELQGRCAEAEESLRAALEVARSQYAKGWELRVATTLAGLLARRGNRAAARDLLKPVYDWFTEGFDTRDLRQARALLTDLETDRDKEKQNAFSETSQ